MPRVVLAMSTFQPSDDYKKQPLIMGNDENEIRALYAESKENCGKYAQAVDNLDNFCLFVGYPRSGHSLVGSLLDAHPNIVIAHELDVVKFLRAGFDQKQMAYLLIENSRRSAEAGRVWREYQYEVPDQWQGQFRDLKILGDKKGGGTTASIGRTPEVLEKLHELFQKKLKFVHVIRNPLDVVASIHKKDNPNLISSANHFFFLCKTNEDIRSKVGKENIIDIWHEDMVSDPKGTLIKLCAFLGQDVSQDYLEACAGIVFDNPDRKSVV